MVRALASYQCVAGSIPRPEVGWGGGGGEVYGFS